MVPPNRAGITLVECREPVDKPHHLLAFERADGSILHQVNPVKGVERKDIKVSDYSNAKKVSVKQFQAILVVIDGTRPSGALYKAAFLFYVLCGRRRREVLALYGRDIRANEQTVEYRATLKGGKRKWKELPPPVWAAIQHYLAVAGRTLSDDSPMFVGTAKYRRKSEATTELKPMTGTTLLYAIKRYAKKAGIDPQKVSLHSLRHLGAELFLEASGDIHETQIFLDHAHLNTTQIYLSQLKGKKHRHWQAMANELALG
jgi:integrase